MMYVVCNEDNREIACVFHDLEEAKKYTEQCWLEHDYFVIYRVDKVYFPHKVSTVTWEEADEG